MGGLQGEDLRVNRTALKKERYDPESLSGHGEKKQEYLESPCGPMKNGGS